jgi:transcriptional regulator with XRE-family HTH domain
MFPVNRKTKISAMKSLRIAGEYRQIDLAAEIGVNQMRISRFERGVSSIPENLGVKIAKALGVDPGDLFREVDE